MAESGGKECEGQAEEREPCNIDACPVDCVWGKFEEWTSCSKTCGSGEKSRTRSKLKEAKNGGAPCDGNAIETETCTLRSCPVDCKWGSFGEWESCSKTCGNGWKTRRRSILITAENGGRECIGNAAESKSCNNGGCSNNCVCF